MIMKNSINGPSPRYLIDTQGECGYWERERDAWQAEQEGCAVFNLKATSFIFALETCLRTLPPRRIYFTVALD